jgi:hypothetical protein
MGRIIKTIDIEGQSAVTLFDSGAVNSHIRAELLAQVPRRGLAKPMRVALGGQHIDIKELCLFNGKIDGLDFSGDAVPVTDLGAADGHKLDAIMGALTMGRWEIKLDPKAGALDLEGLRRREFTEY